jgi:hypothetical protein
MNAPTPPAELENEPLFVAQSQIRATTGSCTPNAQTINATLNSVILSPAKHPSDPKFHPENGFFTEVTEVGWRAESKFRVPSSAFRVVGSRTKAETLK